jgi:hypothetical protein
MKELQDRNEKVGAGGKGVLDYCHCRSDKMGV